MQPEKIRMRRKRLGLTQQELGKHLGVSGNTVARWERGEVVPESPEMLRLALDGLELERGVNSREIKKLQQSVSKNLKQANKSLE